MRSLIVDDDRTSLLILGDILGKHGSCDIAPDGKEAIERYTQALNKGDPYILITLDVMMPNMNGHETIEAIRKLEDQNDIDEDKRVRIIMYTGRDDKEAVLRAFRAGCEAYMRKPIVRDELISKLKELKLIPTDSPE